MYKKVLEPQLAEAVAGERAVFFVDAAHFVHGCFLGWLWCCQRVFVRAPSGRKRFNVLAALNAVTHDLILVTNETHITADSVCELVGKVAQADLTVPISMVMDTASDQRCAKVVLCAAQPDRDGCGALCVGSVYMASTMPRSRSSSRRSRRACTRQAGRIGRPWHSS